MILLFAPIIFAVVVYLAWRNRAVRGCRWRADRSRDKGALHFYRCTACGAEAFCTSAHQPKSCKKDGGGSPL